MRGKVFVRLSRTEAIVILIFLLFSLRVVSWLQYPYIWISGDLRSPLVNEALVRRSFYLWDEVDFGMPSVYPPRLLNPFLLLNTFLQTLGVNLSFSQVITVFLVYFFSSVLMYILVKNLTDGDIIASFIASLYLSSNVYLVNDREISAIFFMVDVFLILPSLIAFVKGIKTKSNKIMALSGILCILSYAGFPNYRLALICLIMLLSLLIFLLIERKSECDQSNTTSIFDLVRLLVTFSIAYAFALIWVLILIYLNFDIFMKAYVELAPSRYKPKISDVMRLTVMWTFYSSTYGKSFLPYGDAYLNNPLIILLCYLPAILAFSSLLLSRKKIVFYFSALALILVLLTTGFSFIGGGSDFYNLLMNFPLIKAFRGSYNWIFFLVISFSILIGCAVSSLCRGLKSKRSRLIAVGLIIAVFVLTTYPLITGDITRNWLNPKIKGTFIPSSYYELNNVLPSNYWSLLLPQRYTYIAYNFSGIPFQTGNPYPLIFSKPIILGIGTDYVQSKSYDLIEEVYRRIQGGVIGEEASKFLGILGIKYLVLEKNFIFGNKVSAEILSVFARGSGCLRLVGTWDEIDLFENAYALERIYAADKILRYESMDDVFNFMHEIEWETLRRSALIESFLADGLLDKGLSMPLEFSWRELSPVRYEVTVRSNGPFLLVLLESYDGMWRVYVNGVQVPEADHVKVNMFANGWLIDAKGDLNITVQYEAQVFFEYSILVSLILQISLFAYLCRRGIVELTRNVIEKCVNVKARIKARILHHKEGVSLLKWLKKKFYYGKNNV